jgi:hypothetical protein
VQEVASLVSQLGYTYSANRQSPTPFSHVLVTGFGGRTKEKMDGMSDAAYRRWANCEFWEEGYEDLWRDGDVAAASRSAPIEEKASERKQGKARAAKESVVYLTADSDVELAELNESETYIIGGIVDHNRYKVNPLLYSHCIYLNPIAIATPEPLLRQSRRLGRPTRAPSNRHLPRTDADAQGAHCQPSL